VIIGAQQAIFINILAIIIDDRKHKHKKKKEKTEKALR
jgi:hypothetical protein